MCITVFIVFIQIKKSSQTCFEKDIEVTQTYVFTGFYDILLAFLDIFFLEESFQH